MTDDPPFDPAAGKVYHCKRCGAEWTSQPLDINEQADFATFHGSAEFDTRTLPVLCDRCFRLQLAECFKDLKWMQTSPST